MLRIHEAALQALEVVGLSNAPASGVVILTGAGAVLGDDGRIRFPRALVEDMLAVAARGITLYDRDPAHDLHLSGKRVHFGTAGAAVHVVDAISGDYRDSTARHLYDAARLAQNLENIHFFQRMMVCRDVPDNYEMDVNTLYACLAGTTKHVGTSFSEPHHVAGCMELMHAVAGGFCPESLLRCVRGIEVTEDSESIEVLKDVCMGGPGHYPGAAQTLGLMEPRQSHQPQGMGGIGLPRASRTRRRAERGYPVPRALHGSADIDATVRADWRIHF